MNKLLTNITLAAAVLAGGAASALEVDGIAARVDSAVILRSDVVTEMRRMGESAPSYEEVLQELVERRLILKAATDVKMTMQEWVVENRIREIIQKGFGGDRNRLMDMLAKQKVPYPEWRQRIKDDMIVAALRWQTVDKNIVISPAAMRREYKEHPGRYVTGRRVTVSVILLKPDDATKRDEVLKALKDETFADVARRYSSDSHAASGGVWKDVDPAEVFRPEVCSALEKLEIGKLSAWIELDGWNFLLRKDADSASKALTFAEACDAIEETLKDKEAARLYEAWIKRLKAEAHVEIVDK